MTVPEKLTALRREMLEAQIDAYIIPTTDPHQSEYPAPRWASREWLSGFTGSAGTLVVTLHEAKLWTDGRYYLQANTQLEGSGIELMKDRQATTPSIPDWLGQHLLDGQQVGCDGRVTSVRTVERYQRGLDEHQLRLVTDEDLVRRIWKDRPAVPEKPAFLHGEEFSGESTAQRLDRLVEWMKKKRIDYYLISALDEIAWLLNLRGTDVDYNPVVVAHLVAGAKGDHVLFSPTRPAFQDLGLPLRPRHEIDLAPYDKLSSYLRRLNATNADIGLDPATVSNRLATYAGGDGCAYLGSPLPHWKAIKTPVALDHLREVMRHDAVALLRLRRWLDVAIDAGLNEQEVELELSRLRSEYEPYVCDSFGAIVGYQGNGAIILYHAPEEGSAQLKREGILLLDSGGQYQNGTTDITRTFALGQPTEEQIRNHTLVLKGHIDLDTAHFPVGTTGVQLDTLARRPLWDAGLNYAHGTGHGVGFFLNVHERPAGISASPKVKSAREPLQAGMVLSNEPGFYKEGEYGIRVENLILVKAADKQGFCDFETLTLFPIDRKLIDTGLLSDAQREWVDSYHGKVLDQVGPLLEPEELKWLTEACAPLTT